MGGLGNQLFQIFTTLSYAIKTGNVFIFSDDTILGVGDNIRRTYWETFLLKLKPFTRNMFPKFNVIKEKDFTYNDIELSEIKNQDVLLYGYFQSYKYFHNSYNVICKVIGLDNMKEKLLEELKLDKLFFENYISMHFRIGDYKKVQAYHPLTTYTFYESSLKHIKKINHDKTFNILYFCEDQDIDDVLDIVNKLIIKFPTYNFTRGENSLKDWEQMLLMSLCHHNIIANSSFSWWSAYFNSWEDKTVCYPSVWFGEIAKNDTKDLQRAHANGHH
jgi:hypothetical protein